MNGGATALRNNKHSSSFLQIFLSAPIWTSSNPTMVRKIQFLKELDGDNYADVATKIIDNKGQEYSVNYRLHKVSGDWKVYDVVIEDISLVNNYRSQFSRVLAKSSYEELVSTMKGKTLIPPGTKR